MSRNAPQERQSKGTRSNARPNGGGDFFHFLRQSHIFSSAVREVLESKLLREATPLPLTTSQINLLKLMLVDGEHQVGKAADYLGVSPPAATKSIDKLERLELVTRSPSKGDRRATLLSVSPKGKRLVRKYEDLKAARLSEVLKKFKREEVKQLAQLLERFSVSLLELEEADNGFCLHCAAYLEKGCGVGLIRNGCPHEKGSEASTNNEEANANS